MSTPKINQWQKEDHENAIKLTPIGRDILHSSTQVRRDSKTIVLIRNKK